MARQEPERFDALQRAGFLTERYGSMTHHIYNLFGKHYMDVGASAKIAKGLVSYYLFISFQEVQGSAISFSA